MEMSRKIAEMECTIAMLQYHGEYWLLPYFYYLSRPTGAVFLNVVPPLPRSMALPFQELTLRRRIMERLIDLSHVGKWRESSLRNLALLMTPSKYLLEQAEQQGVVGLRRAEVVPLGVDHSEFYPTGEEEPFALYLGRIHPHKSIELAILAMRNTKPDTSLVIAGDFEEGHLWYKEKLIRLAEKARIPDRLRIIAFPSDREVVRLMQRCSVFLFPSTIDTFGLVVLEAMACGKPIVACNRAGVPEVTGDAGFLVEPKSEQWQKAVAKIFSDSRLRRQMGRKSLERSKNFSWESTAKRLLCTLNNIKC
jgi:glycosyltransferase involved in cell wall biosynthesis